MNTLILLLNLASLTKIGPRKQFWKWIFSRTTHSQISKCTSRKLHSLKPTAYLKRGFQMWILRIFTSIALVLGALKRWRLKGLLCKVWSRTSNAALSLPKKRDGEPDILEEILSDSGDDRSIWWTVMGVMSPILFATITSALIWIFICKEDDFENDSFSLRSDTYSFAHKFTNSILNVDFGLELSPRTSESNSDYLDQTSICSFSDSNESEAYADIDASNLDMLRQETAESVRVATNQRASILWTLLGRSDAFTWRLTHQNFRSVAMRSKLISYVYDLSLFISML